MRQEKQTLFIITGFYYYHNTSICTCTVAGSSGDESRLDKPCLLHSVCIYESALEVRVFVAHRHM